MTDGQSVSQSDRFTIANTALSICKLEAMLTRCNKRALVVRQYTKMSSSAGRSDVALAMRQTLVV